MFFIVQVFGCSFSPDGNKIVSCSGDETVRIWEVGSGKELHKLEGHTSVVSCFLFYFVLFLLWVCLIII